MRICAAGVIIIRFPHYRHPVPFTAHISPNADEFSVYPTTGELPAIGTQGSLICVSYRPLVYGKSHTAKAVIQVSNYCHAHAVIR